MTPDVIDIVCGRLGVGVPAYDEYRRLRHGIFVVEQGWRDLDSADEPGRTPPDPADERARFWLARAGDGRLIGVVRVCAVGDVFPHEELFVHHLAVPAFAGMRGRLGSLNSLAVSRDWRRRRCVDPAGRPGTVASLLLDHCLEDCAGDGLDAIVATAQTLVSVRALMRAGFHVIDAPRRTPLHPTFSMCNVGLVAAPRDRPAGALADYFRRCEQGVLGGLMETAPVPVASAP